MQLKKKILSSFPSFNETNKQTNASKLQMQKKKNNKPTMCIHSIVTVDTRFALMSELSAKPEWVHVG